MAATGSVLFVGRGEALDEARASLVRAGVEAREAGTAEVAEDAAGEPAVAVIAASAASPAVVARRLRQAHPAIRIVFVAGAAEHEALRRVLLYSAPANTPWQLVQASGAEIERAVLESLEEARRARQVRTTLDRVNLRLAATQPADTNAWRRLVVSDQYLATVLKHAQDAIVSLDLRGNVLSWNDGATRMFGRKPREAVGESIDRVVAWEGSLRALVEAAVREGYVRGEMRCRVFGREMIIDATLTAVEQRRSDVLAVAAILRDITGRVRTEERLARNEARFRALADNIPQLAWMTDESGGITWYNQRWFDYTGTTLESMQGSGWIAVHHPDHRDRVVEKFSRHIASGEPWEDTFPLRSRSGEYRWFLSRAFPIRDEAGRVLQWFGTNTDVTEQRAAEQALREADRRKNEFIGMLSHELRNPLAPIRNAIYLMERVPPDSPAVPQARGVIRRQTDHLTRLVDDLLDVTRVTSGKLVLARAPADLAAIVRAAAEDHRALLEAQGLALSLSLPPRPVHAVVDAARIAQVLGNLLQNALKFTPRGGSIEVNVATVGHDALVRVCDTGVGIEPTLLGNLFQPFVQGDRTLERSQGGLGLGLALARGIAEMHGGTLEASSAGTGKGAQFTLRLPLGTQAHAIPEPPASPRPAAAHNGRRVLIVDDNRDAAESLAGLVALFGHEAEVVHDGPSALERIRRIRPDVVLCDIGLPGMSGYEVAAQVRESGPDVRLVAVSGYAREEDLRLARESGFDEHIAKPASPERIRRLLEELPR